MMNKMKKLLALTLTLALALSLAACGGSDTSAAGEDTSSPQDAQFTVGIINYVDDPSLNQIQAAIEAELAANDIAYVSQNAQADQSTITTIANQMIESGVDLLIPIATPTAMVVQNATSENQLPVVFAAVSDPVGAGLVASMDAPGGNITGSSDALDTANIFNLITALNPDLTKVGLLYDASQDSSTLAIQHAKEFLDANNIAYVENSGTTIDGLSLAADALIAEGVEVVFPPTDNTVQVAEPALYQKFIDAGIQHFCGADSFALVGAFCGYGVDYENLGTMTGKMAVKILVGGADPAETPIQTFDNGKASINTDTCAALGLDFEEVSSTLEPLCTMVEGLVTSDSF